MHMNMLYCITMNIATRMVPSFHHKTTFSCQMCQMSKCCSHQSRTNNQIVILPFHHNYTLYIIIYATSKNHIIHKVSYF